MKNHRRQCGSVSGDRLTTLQQVSDATEMSISTLSLNALNSTFIVWDRILVGQGTLARHECCEVWYSRFGRATSRQVTGSTSAWGRTP
jgi:hypothetical protein